MNFNNFKGKNKKYIMGILNITPDSFYDGGRYLEKDIVLKRVEKMLEEGADIIDMGAYSTRPGAKVISEEEELKRLSSFIHSIYLYFPEIKISIDTYRSKVAEKMIKDYDVSIINDISGGTLDDKMFQLIADNPQVSYILMHMRGAPQTMQSQKNTTYKDLFTEILDFFETRISDLKKLNVNNIIIDPGFGFAKTIEQNYKILKNLSKFTIFEQAILVGLSRKSMLWKLLQTSPEQSLNATTVVNTLALENGATILRVHDVKEAAETIKIFNQYNK